MEDLGCKPNSLSECTSIRACLAFVAREAREAGMTEVAHLVETAVLAADFLGTAPRIN